MINKELQDLAWSLLPKEFKEEVKKIWEHENKELVPIDAVTALNEIFGLHNLTSDAEGEEMLTVPRKKVLYMYDFNEDILICDPTHNGAKLLKAKLQDLFGSKCLPDETTSPEPKPAEPKFKSGDMVIYKRTGKKKVVFGMDKYGRYHVALPNMQSPMYVDESDLEPYIESDYNFNIGDLVLVDEYDLPYQVIKILPDNKVILDDNKTYEMSQLKKYESLIPEDPTYKLQKLETASRILAGMCTRGVGHTMESRERMVSTAVIMADMLLKRIINK